MKRPQTLAPPSLSTAARNRIVAFLTRVEPVYVSSLHEAIARSQVGYQQTAFALVTRALAEQHGIRLDDIHVFAFEHLAISEVGDQTLLLAACYARIICDGVLPDGMRRTIGGARLESALNEILESDNFPYRITRNGLAPVEGSRSHEVSQKFGILGSPGQAELDFTLWTKEGPVAVFFFDIDHFKSLNTRFTEMVVDEAILIPFQRFLVSLIASRGGAYTYGGDEFLILLRNVTEAEAVAFGERLREGCNDLQFQPSGQEARITISAGVTVAPRYCSDFTSHKKAANAAEKIAKSSGRNQVIVAGAP